MCFDIGIEVCGPNEALVISGLFYVSDDDCQEVDLLYEDIVSGRTSKVYCRWPSTGISMCPDNTEAASKYDDTGGQDSKSLHCPGCPIDSCRSSSGQDQWSR